MQGRLRFMKLIATRVWYKASLAKQLRDHLQAHYESTKSANKSSKPTKY